MLLPSDLKKIVKEELEKSLRLRKRGDEHNKKGQHCHQFKKGFDPLTPECQDCKIYTSERYETCKEAVEAEYSEDEDEYDEE